MKGETGGARRKRRAALLIVLGAVLRAAEMWLGWRILADNVLGAFLIFIGLGYCLGGGIWLALTPPGDAPHAADRSLLGFLPATFLMLVAMPLGTSSYPQRCGVFERCRGSAWVSLGWGWPAPLGTPVAEQCLPGQSADPARATPGHNRPLPTSAPSGLSRVCPDGARPGHRVLEPGRSSGNSAARACVALPHPGRGSDAGPCIRAGVH